jgi:hypothetical protein
MKKRILISLCMIAALATAASAEPKSSRAQQDELDAILKIVTQMQSDLKALQSAVGNLAASQTAQAAQIKDVARRLYATCVLSQRQMDITVPGGWSENALCTDQGLNAGGPDVKRDIFGQNPVNIDTAFGAR